MVVVPAVWKTPFGTVHVMLNGADTGVRVSKALIEDLGPVDFVNVFRSYLSEEIGARLDEAFLGTAVRDEVRGVLGP